jgi:hypothetical protein
MRVKVSIATIMLCALGLAACGSSPKTAAWTGSDSPQPAGSPSDISQSGSNWPSHHENSPDTKDDALQQKMPRIDKKETRR